MILTVQVVFYDYFSLQIKLKNWMKKIVLTIIILILNINVFGQVKFEKGFIINNNNEKIRNSPEDLLKTSGSGWLTTIMIMKPTTI